MYVHNGIYALRGNRSYYQGRGRYPFRESTYRDSQRARCAKPACALPFLLLRSIILISKRKPKKQTSKKEDVGKLLLDLGKLVFGALFLGGILRGALPQVILIIGGITASAMLCIAGLILGIREKKNGENGNSPAKKE